MADKLRSALSGDIVASRFSDHTFAVLARGHDHTQTQALAERIRALFEAQILEIGQQSLSMTVSLGGVQIGEKIASLPQILARASAGLQSAQGVGGNRIEVYDPAARDRAEDERIQAWVQRIREALREDQFVLNFQPMISLTGDPNENYEVLLRMKAPNGEVVAPDQFMPIAEEHGLLVDLDRWVIGRTIKLLAEQRKAGKETTLYVKVAPSSLVEGDLHNYIGSQLKAHSVSGEHLVLQLPESKIYNHLRPLQAFQKIVASFGCRLCLEQFGTSLNSFQMLSHFEPAILKIDRSFIIDLSKNPENQKKVREFVAQALAAGMLQREPGSVHADVFDVMPATTAQVGQQFPGTAAEVAQDDGALGVSLDDVEHDVEPHAAFQFVGPVGAARAVPENSQCGIGSREDDLVRALSHTHDPPARRQRRAPPVRRPGPARSAARSGTARARP